MSAKNQTKRQQKTRDGENGWPVRLAMCEAAIRKQDEAVFKGNSYFVDEIVRVTEARVREANKTKALALSGKTKKTQTDAFDFLCERGCPRRELLYLLGMCENRGVTNSVKMTGYDAEELRKILCVLRTRADALWAVSCYEFGRFLEAEERSTLFGFLRLPEMLLEYSALVDTL